MLEIVLVLHQGFHLFRLDDRDGKVGQGLHRTSAAKSIGAEDSKNKGKPYFFGDTAFFNNFAGLLQGSVGVGLLVILVSRADL